MESLKASSRRLQETIERLGFRIQVKQMEKSTRTAVQAAEAVGCSTAQIVKSLLLQGKDSGKPYLALVSGVNRLDLKLLKDQVGEPVTMADPEFVRQVTGFAIGGVPPAGHNQDIDTFIDRDLLDHKVLWAAAGTPSSMFAIKAADLVALTRGRVVELKS